MLLALLVLCVALFVVLPLIGAAVNVLWALVLGLVLGSLARVIAPGRGSMGCLFTSLVGLAGGLSGAVVARALGAGSFGRLLLQVLAAVVLVMVLRPSKGARA